MLKHFTTLETQILHANILQVTLTRPEVRNAINSVMMLELRDLWQHIHINCAEYSCIILTGKGEKAFCAGADLKERNNLDTHRWQQQHTALEQAMLAMLHCPVPIIAAVNGAAFGGGFELMLASDFAYAADHATFGFPEVKIGIIPGAMGTQNLPRACGIRKAKEICMTGAPFSAREAYDWGIISKICPAETLSSKTVETAIRISQNAPLAIRQVKKSINTAEAGLAQGYMFEIEAYNALIPTHDRLEGIKAFNEKRAPKFIGS